MISLKQAAQPLPRNGTVVVEANPFVHRGPIRDPAYFHGRRQELSRAFDLLRQAQSVSILGPRQIGKTSFLFHLAHPTVCQAYGLAPERHCFVYVNCESWGDLARHELLDLLRQEMAEALRRAGHHLELHSSALPAGGYRAFEQAVRTVTAHQIQLVFMLDEFAALSANPHLDAQFFSGLRSLATRYGVAYITVSTEILLELTYSQTSVLSSPFFNFFAQLRLRPFSRSEAEQLLTNLAARGGLGFGQDTLDFLLELAGPHPFYLQLAAYHAFDCVGPGNVTLNETTREEVRRRFLAEVEPHWTYAWRNLSPKARKELALLPLTGQTDIQAVERLCDGGLALRRNEEVAFLSPTFQAFVARQPVPGLLQAPPVILDTEQRIALLAGQPLSLTPTEFDLLACLAGHAGQVIAHQEIEAQVWPGEYIEDPDRLKTGLKTLRRALGNAAGCIQNVRGVGYRFAPPLNESPPNRHSTLLNKKRTLL